jgi:hypothetical protein
MQVKIGPSPSHQYADADTDGNDFVGKWVSPN